jgi:hypothetical protein
VTDPPAPRAFADPPVVGLVVAPVPAPVAAGADGGALVALRGDGSSALASPAPPVPQAASASSTAPESTAVVRRRTVTGEGVTRALLPALGDEGNAQSG